MQAGATNSNEADAVQTQWEPAWLPHPSKQELASFSKKCCVDLNILNQQLYRLLKFRLVKQVTVTLEKLRILKNNENTFTMVKS